METLRVLMDFSLVYDARLVLVGEFNGIFDGDNVLPWLALILSIMAARVVDLPDPVGPVTKIRPRGFAHRSLITGGSPSSSKERIWYGISLNAPASVPRCMKILARNRLRPRTPNDRSSS